jgi:DNA-binding transcriptional ArsR family regulator
MTRRKRQTLTIRDPETVRALRTPLRREILEALIRLGRGSVRDLASEVGRAPAALYYHVHALERARLIRESGTRRGGARGESVYEPVAARIVLDRTVRSRPFLEAIADLQRSTLRAAERELTRALERGDDAPSESVSLMRATARLRPAPAKKARRKLVDLVRFLAENDDPKAPGTFALTAALVRIEPRRR